MEYKNLKSYKNFLNEKYKLILEGDDIKKETDEEKQKKENIAFVKDPNNPLDEAINGKIKLLKKKIDIYTKDSDGKQIYTAYAYSNMKMIEIEEQIIKLKNDYFINVETNGEVKGENEQEQDIKEQGTDESIKHNFSENINEGLLKKLFDFAKKKLVKYGEEIKAAKKMDPIFEEAKNDITKLFKDKKNIDAWKKVNGEKIEEIKKEQEQKLKELGELTKSISVKLDKIIEEKKDDKGGETEYKVGEIYSYKNTEGLSFRIIMTQTENVLKAMRISENDKDKKLVQEEPLEKPGEEFEPNKDEISIIGEDNIKNVNDKFEKIKELTIKEKDIKIPNKDANDEETKS